MWARSTGTPANPPPPSAVDYSDGSMQEAQHLLRALAAFAQDARAYMKGQLVCGPIRDDVLWERWVLPDRPREPWAPAGGCLEGSEASGG